MSDQAQSAIMERLKKMLALAENAGATEDEASNAANMAAALALKYGIDLEQLQRTTHQPRAGFEYVVIHTDKGGFEQWLMNLIGGVCAIHGNRTFFQGNARIGVTQYCAILRKDMVPVVTATMDYLVKAVLRMNTEAVKGRNLSQPERAAFRKAFRIACSARIRQRMHDRLREMMQNDDAAKQATGSTALVVLNHIEAEVKEMTTWMEDQGFRFKESKSRGPRHLDAAGYAAGKAAGDRVGLDAQVTGTKGVDTGKRLR